MPSLSDLRARHPVLTFQHIKHELQGTDWRVTFKFHLAPDIDFAPTLTWQEITAEQLSAIPPQQLDQLLLAIGMVELLSYWKAACPPTIEIQAGALSPDQVKWWQHLLLNGMGEFFYKNQIDFTGPDFVQIKSREAAAATPDQPSPPVQAPQRVLVPLGGGKDSAVTAHLLLQQREHGQLQNVLGWAINPTPATQQMAELLGLPLISIERQLDPQLLQLNQAGYLNGHTPFSALLAFTSILTARLHGLDTVATSNEHSANEGNVVFMDQNINHQYSKSLEFEQAVARYTASWSNCPRYISLLRPLNELQIARLFAPLTKLHSVFVSCNRQQPTRPWCGQCPKCLSTFACLFPFLGEANLSQIFGQNLWHSRDIFPLLQELLGLTQAKPFECVMTFAEMRAAVWLATTWYQQQHLDLPPLLQMIQAQLAELPISAHDTQSLLTKFNPEHQLPPAWLTMLETSLQQSPMPQYD